MLVASRSLTLPAPCTTACAARGTRSTMRVTAQALTSAAEMEAKPLAGSTLPRVQSAHSVTSQPTAAAAGAAEAVPELSVPAASSAGRTSIGEQLADGSVMFRNVHTCCGHALGEQADGSVLFRF
ncbi:hypothetical protein ACK3TF_005941 [Chlorella vulgaris]